MDQAGNRLSRRKSAPNCKLCGTLNFYSMIAYHDVMARNFRELYAKLDPERRALVETRVREALKAIRKGHITTTTK
jgi:hypothetical protein